MPGCLCKARVATERRALAPPRAARWLRGRGGSRRTTRVPVPKDLIAAVRFVVRNGEAMGPDVWDAVKEEMEALIESQVPEGATGVRAILDEERTEVVVSYLEEQA